MPPTKIALNRMIDEEAFIKPTPNIWDMAGWITCTSWPLGYQQLDLAMGHHIRHIELQSSAPQLSDL